MRSACSASGGVRRGGGGRQVQPVRSGDGPAHVRRLLVRAGGPGARRGRQQGGAAATLAAARYALGKQTDHPCLSDHDPTGLVQTDRCAGCAHRGERLSTGCGWRPRRRSWAASGSVRWRRPPAAASWACQPSAGRASPLPPPRRGPCRARAWPLPGASASLARATSAALPTAVSTPAAWARTRHSQRTRGGFKGISTKQADMLGDDV